MTANLSPQRIAEIKAQAEAKRGEYLGRIRFWGLDVFEGSPQPWIDALMQERSQDG